jgi:NAD(P)H-hydrate epimerase
VAALLCQRIGGAVLEPFAAARLATWVHGHAGDIAAQRFGEISLIARDILEALPEAFKAVVQTG